MSGRVTQHNVTMRYIHPGSGTVGGTKERKSFDQMRVIQKQTWKVWRGGEET